MNVNGLSQAYSVLSNHASSLLSKSSYTEETNTTATDAEFIQSPSASLNLTGLFGKAPGELITIDEIKSFGMQQMESFQDQFTALLEANGIDTSIPITLTHEYGSGDIIVTNDHPDADQIEALLEDNHDLRNVYTSTTNALGLAKTAEEGRLFQEAYRQNPRAAVAQYNYLFGSSWDISTTFCDDEFQMDYQRSYHWLG